LYWTVLENDLIFKAAAPSKGSISIYSLAGQLLFNTPFSKGEVKVKLNPAQQRFFSVIQIRMANME
jgi:hypothetical protein